MKAATITMFVAGLATVKASTSLIDTFEDDDFEDTLPEEIDEAGRALQMGSFGDDMKGEMQSFDESSSPSDETEDSSESDSMDRRGRRGRGRGKGRGRGRGRGKGRGRGRGRGGWGKGKKGWGRKGKKGMRMMRLKKKLMGMMKKGKAFDPEKHAQLMERMSKMMEKMSAWKCKAINKWRGKFCKSREDDEQEDCQTWAQVMNEKCQEKSVCKMEHKKNMFSCMAGFRMLSASFMRDEGKVEV